MQLPSVNLLIKRFLVLALSLTTLLTSHPVFAAPQIYMRSNWKLVVKDKEYEAKWYSGRFDLGSTLSDNAEAFKEYEEYQSWGRIGTALNWGALGLALGYMAITPADSRNSGTFWTVFLVPWVAGIVCSLTSAKSFTRMINIYNGVAPSQATLTPGSSSEGTKVALTPSLGLSVTF